MDCLVIPSDTFYERLSSLDEELGSSTADALSALVEALKRLKSYAWDGSLPLKPYGSSGSSYEYEFYPGFVFTFRRETERDRWKQPVRIKLVLKSVQRAS